MRRKPPTTTGASQSRRSARPRSTTATLDRSRTIRLPRGTWVLEPTPLGRGGFGAVFPGKGEDGREVAVKQLDPLGKLPIDRELQVTEGLVGRNCAHVIPILDVGRDATGDVFIVMARATETRSSTGWSQLRSTTPAANLSSSDGPSALRRPLPERWSIPAICRSSWPASDAAQTTTMARRSGTR